MNCFILLYFQHIRSIPLNVIFVDHVNFMWLFLLLKLWERQYFCTRGNMHIHRSVDLGYGLGSWIFFFVAVVCVVCRI
ncbi:hypothetical protein GDO86_012135 [Hymenochirus boettgeri]|uniref:Uncharacterized protein n=1 Tax=Hymenochirus boettgeri TaxID=247094 RepID=A0A8T2IRJ6_9PIPI|nr:hypothetical protein GDO86_012135 [Hymenochirus boettgeri]